MLPLKVSIVDRSSTGHTFVNDQPAGKGNVMKLSAGDVPQLHERYESVKDLHEKKKKIDMKKCAGEVPYMFFMLFLPLLLDV